MPSKFMNGVAAKHCVTCYEHHEETALDVLEDFVDWTKKKKIKRVTLRLLTCCM